jgi:hypothetical protein
MRTRDWLRCRTLERRGRQRLSGHLQSQQVLALQEKTEMSVNIFSFQALGAD